jgi:hypothetical protein
MAYMIELHGGKLTTLGWELRVQFTALSFLNPKLLRVTLIPSHPALSTFFAFIGEQQSKCEPVYTN